MTDKYYVNAVFDNEGETIDRYTIHVMSDEESFIVATSENPSHPQGVWSCDEGGYLDSEEVRNNPEENKHIGVEIEWHELPETVRSALNNYFEEE